MHLGGSTIAITGGARGIGLATARALSARGARVAIGDLDGDGAAAAIGSDGLGLELDVTDPDAFARFVAEAEAQLGPIDVLVNNAGVMPIGPFVAETHATARRILEVNVLGPITGMKLVLPGMLARGRGHIVNVASIAGREPAPGASTYCASKAAVVMLTESARAEYAGAGIAFTCVMPSFTATELIAGTQGMRFVPTVSPADVGAAIAAVVAQDQPQPDLFVPAVVGWASRLNRLVGRRVRDRIAHQLGADRTFLDVDTDARAEYHERIAAPAEVSASAQHR
jgi:NAD(P)-dependent dehydrogenase (short-subunit alcohol dehydrogenase family)